MDRSDVEDCVLDGDQIELMDTFMTAESDFKVLLALYQEPDEQQNDDSGKDDSKDGGATGPVLRLNAGAKPVVPNRANKPRITVTDGKDIALSGVCCMFYKASPTSITSSNISKELCFFPMDCKGEHGKGLLGGISQVLSTIFVPALTKNEDSWGQLKENRDGSRIRGQFISSIESFVCNLHEATVSLDDTIVLAQCTTHNLAKLKTNSEFLQVASSPEQMTQIESIVQTWMKQIEQVLAESEQIRKESDSIGPRAELDYWKHRMAKFSSLLDQLKAPEVRSAISILKVAKSRVLKQWLELDRRITDSTNEAKDNVKFLYTLDKWCDPLYENDPTTMLDSVAGLLNAIRMIYSISKFYNTSERLTSLFAKITTQMVTSCKSYITNHGVDTVWTQDMDEVQAKMNECLKLNAEYQAQYHKTKEKLAQSPDEKPFDLSEMYIFGKFETFSRRLKKITDIFETIKTYSTLQECRIEGIDLMYAKFNVAVVAIKKKKYDFLNLRNQDFDQDYEDFKRQVDDLRTAVMAFFDTKFNRVNDTAEALRTLRKFENLALPNLNFEERYMRILMAYGRDIETISKLYQRNKADPPLPRNWPPIAGRIAWVRQLYRRLADPMEAFSKHPTILQSADAKKLIRQYNKVCGVLLEYEMLYHKEAYLKQVDAVRMGLQATVFVRHPETKNIFVNYDPAVNTVIRETELLVRLDVEIPPFAKQLLQRQHQLKERKQSLDYLLDEFSRVKKKVPNAFELLMSSHMNKVLAALEPGWTIVTWTSVNFQQFVENAHVALGEFELLIDRANQLTEFRIDSVFAEMTQVPLVELPEDEPWTVDEFFERTRKLCQKGAHILQTKSINVEDAAIELINMLMEDSQHDKKEPTQIDGTIEEGEEAEEGEANDEEDKSENKKDAKVDRGKSVSSANPARRRKDQRDAVEEVANDLLAHFSHRNLDSLVKVTRHALESLRRRLTQKSPLSLYGSSSRQGGTDSKGPFFRVDSVLTIPNVSIQPTIEEVQHAVNKGAQMIVGVSKGVTQWTKRNDKAAGSKEEKKDGNL